MTAPLHRFATPDPTCCGVCRRRAGSWGHAPRAGAPILWLCADEGCLQAGRKVYAMSERDMDAFEARARDAAGDVGGLYLDTLGKTDFAALSPEEWQTFLSRVLDGFGDSLRTQILNHQAPF